jgi:hypothetical protein
MYANKKKRKKDRTDTAYVQTEYRELLARFLENITSKMNGKFTNPLKHSVLMYFIRFSQ